MRRGHGKLDKSRYDIEGRVFRNASGNSTEPAPSDLKQFATTYDVATGIIAITIPDLALAVHSLKVVQRNGSGNPRLKFRGSPCRPINLRLKS